MIARIKKGEKYNKQVNIISINVDSIVSNKKRYNLFDLMDNFRPDVILLNETKLNNRHRIEFKNYNIVRNDRENNKGGGGTAILISSKFKFVKVNLKSEHIIKCLETTIIKLKINNNQNLFIISAYASGNVEGNLGHDLNTLASDLKPHDRQNRYVLAGDLNAKHEDWLNHSNNVRGMQLKDWVNINDTRFRTILVGPSKTTFPKGCSYLDLCIIDHRLEIQNLVNNKLKVTPYDSDHNAIHLNIFVSGIQDLEINEPNINHKFNLNKTDWAEFQSYFSSYNEPVPCNVNLSNQEIDAYLSNLNDWICRAIEATVPKIINLDSLKKYITPRITKLQKIKSNLITRRHKLKKQRAYIEEI